VKLPADDFQTIVRKAPLVSIDLVITDSLDCCLLGRRKIRPAKGTMFVPGGRILKNESIDSAFKRILLAETGHRINEQDEQYLLGVYEHFYDDSFWDEKISTHYIVLAYRIKLRTRFLEKLDKQHDLLEWLSIDELLSRSDVHKNVKAYFS
jgi:colanic acid biosynthesis protein WcaH